MQAESSLSTVSGPGAPAREPRLPYAPPEGQLRLRLTVQWDGRDFVGWQSQPGLRSVQDTLQAALTELSPVAAFRPVAAGRTDTGVHAERMTLHWDVPGSLRLAPDRLARALNARLPEDVAVTGCVLAAPDFHARYSCVAREYVYRVLNAPQREPLWAGRALLVPPRLDVDAMQAAARELLGEHDFAAFATREERQTRRRLDRLEVRRVPGSPLLEVHLTGESFLRHMVRGLVGTLLQVGRGERLPGDVVAVLASGDRGRAGPNVPPHGLYFTGARYPGD